MMMATLAEGRNVIWSPLRNGKIVKVGGVPHQVIRQTRAVGEIVYRTRNMETGELVKVSYNVMDDHNPPALTQVEEEGYFQITGLSPDEREATLKFPSEPYEEATFSLRKLDEEELSIITDGLRREDQEVFCTVVKIMGKEVMGNIKCLSKDPTILRMPELVTDMIFSCLSKEDRLNCRLVDKYWAYELLPFRKFMRITNVSLNQCSINVLHLDPQCRGKVDTLKFKTQQALCDTQLLRHAQGLSTSALIQEGVGRRLLEDCQHLEHLEASVYLRPKYMWSVIHDLIFNNKDHLKLVKISDSSKSGGNVDLKPLVDKCTSLETLHVKAYNKTCVKNVRFLPLSLTNLRLTHLTFPLTKTQIEWIVSHLKRLVDVELDVKHIHGSVHEMEEDEEEFDKEAVSEILTNLPSLQHILLCFTRESPEYDNPTLCGKAVEITNYTNNLDGWVCRGGRYTEYLDIDKV